MLAKQLAATLAVFAGLTLAGSARAEDDVIRLNLSGSSATTRTLEATDDDLVANVLDVARYGYRGGYRGYHGGYRGYYGGYRGYYGGYRGYYGGYRGYYAGYRGFYGYPRYYGYYRGFYGYPRYYGGYYGYYGPRVFVGVGGIGVGVGVGYGYGYPGYYPVGYGGYGYADGYSPYTGTRRVIVTSGPTVLTPPTPVPEPIPVTPDVDRGTFPYDGGPTNPVPVPDTTGGGARELLTMALKPTVIPYREVEKLDRLVSQPASEKTGKWTYPAYGELPRRTAKDR